MGTSRRTAGWVGLALLGAVALTVSFVLHPTPPTVTRIDGQAFRSTTMHAVDYIIIGLRIAGVAFLGAGAYLTYRRLRPDVAGDTNDGATRHVDLPIGARPEAGTRNVRPANGLWRNGP